MLTAVYYIGTWKYIDGFSGKTEGGGQMFDGFAILCNDAVGASCVRKTE
jgi:hypothetical protein